MYNDDKLEENWKKLLNRLTEGANGWGAGYSSFKTHAFKGHTIETAYNEDSASALAWNAFVKGFGTYIGASREEALEKAKNKITSTAKKQ